MDLRIRPAARQLITRHGVVLGALFLGALVGAWVTRHGMGTHPDTPYYRSAAQHWRDGDWLMTSLSPPFTRFRLSEVVQRGGRIPFVDFPIGYPMAWGSLSWVVGFARAGRLISILSAALVAAGATTLVRREAGRRHSAVLAVTVGVLLVLTPEMTLGLQSLQSEGLMCAAVTVVLALSISVVGPRGPWRMATGATPSSTRSLLVVAMWATASFAGVVRFVGVAVLVAPTIAELMRGTRLPIVARRLALAAVPAVASVVWASTQGAARMRLHALSSADMTEARLTVTGWWWGDSDSIATALGNRPSPMSSVVLAITVIAVGAMLVVALRRRDAALLITSSTAVALAAANLAGMVLFDQFVSFTPRIMLTTQLCVVLAGVQLAARQWSKRPAVTLAAAAVWALAAVTPWTSLSRTLPVSAPRVDATIAAVIERHRPAVVISNASIDVEPVLGIPSAAPPEASNRVTGAPLDLAAETDGLACALASHHGIVAISSEAGFAGIAPAFIEWLEAEIDAGRLGDEVAGTYRVFVPTSTACPAQK